MDHKAKILLVDDEIKVINALRRVLDREEYELISTTSPEEAIDMIMRNQFDLIICDEKMPDKSGMDILKFAKEIRPDTIRILITGYSDLNVAVSAINEGSIFYYFSKPWKNEELIKIVHQGLKQKREQEKNRALPFPQYERKISLWDSEDIILMNASEVYYFAAINGAVVVVTRKGNYKSAEPLNYWERKLEGMNFFRCHRSYIVNIDKIEKISPWFHGTLNLKLREMKESIPVSRNSSRKLKEFIGL